MNSNQIIQTIRESAYLLSQDFDGLTLSELDSSPREYDKDEISEFRRDLIEAANKQRIIFIENSLTRDEFQAFINDVEIPLVAFEETEDALIPIIFFKENRKLKVLQLFADSSEAKECGETYFPNLYEENGKVSFMGVFSYKSLVSDDPDEGEEQKKLNPVQRLFRL